MKRTEKDNFPGGILAINKCPDMTSHDVINRVRRLYNTKRVGHAGTLDPLATGVLVVLVGRAAKACEYISSDQKTYTATLRLGITTDTEDITGSITSHCDSIPSAAEVTDACRNFVGKIKQIPPMYSAIKVDGQKLYDLARKGVVIEREARDVEIFSVECSPIQDSNTDYSLCVTCSGGTYIRTLCADIGAALGCGGVMAALRRDEACGISLCDCHSLGDLEGLTCDQLDSLLIPTEKLFEDLPAVTLSAFFERLFRGGCPIYQKKIKTDLPLSSRVRIRNENGDFFALGEVTDTPEGSAIRSVKIFGL